MWRNGCQALRRGRTSQTVPGSWAPGSWLRAELSPLQVRSAWWSSTRVLPSGLYTREEIPAVQSIPSLHLPSVKGWSLLLIGELTHQESGPWNSNGPHNSVLACYFSLMCQKSLVLGKYLGSFQATHHAMRWAGDCYRLRTASHLEKIVAYATKIKRQIRITYFKMSVKTCSQLTISFQRHKSPDLHAPVQLPLALQRSLGGLVSQGLLKRFSELRAKLAHSEHFYSVSVHSPEVVNYSTGGFDQIFRCPLSNLHRFQHIALIQSLRKDVLASHVPRQNLKWKRKVFSYWLVNCPCSAALSVLQRFRTHFHVWDSSCCFDCKVHRADAIHWDLYRWLFLKFTSISLSALLRDNHWRAYPIHLLWSFIELLKRVHSSLRRLHHCTKKKAFKWKQGQKKARSREGKTILETWLIDNCTL